MHFNNRCNFVLSVLLTYISDAIATLSPTQTSTLSPVQNTTSQGSVSDGGPAINQALVIGLSVAGSVVGCICILRLSCLACEDRIAARFGWAKKKPLRAHDENHHRHRHEGAHGGVLTAVTLRTPSSRNPQMLPIAAPIDAPPTAGVSAAPAIATAGGSSAALLPAAIRLDSDHASSAPSMHRVKSFK